MSDFAAGLVELAAVDLSLPRPEESWRVEWGVEQENGILWSNEHATVAFNKSIRYDCASNLESLYGHITHEDEEVILPLVQYPKRQ